MSRIVELQVRIICTAIKGIGPKDVNDKTYLRLVARSIANNIYDTRPVKYSGLVSESMIDDHGWRKPGAVQEHYVSRMRAATELVNQYIANGFTLSSAYILEWLERVREVHLTSRAENNRLRRFQKDYSLTPEQQYAMAGVNKLEKDPGPAPSWYYKTDIINGVVYSNIRDASLSAGVDYEILRKRCSSPAKKWADWQTR